MGGVGGVARGVDPTRGWYYHRCSYISCVVYSTTKDCTERDKHNKTS